MNRSVISQRITSILDDIQRLNSALYAMNPTDIQCYLDNYDVWQAAGGTFGTAQEFPDSGFLACLAAVFR